MFAKGCFGEVRVPLADPPHHNCTLMRQCACVCVRGVTGRGVRGAWHEQIKKCCLAGQAGRMSTGGRCFCVVFLDLSAHPAAGQTRDREGEEEGEGV